MLHGSKKHVDHCVQVSQVRYRPAMIVMLLAGLQLNVALGQHSVMFPGMQDDAQTLRVQQKVDEIFQRGDYQRALFIYRNELAPIGDKFAQYMVGYMYLTGRGVDPDRIRASAWYRLAAERGTPQFIAARNELIAGFGEGERAQSDLMYRDLRHNLSDLAILVRLLRKDQETLRSRTGSRLAAGSGPLMIVDPSHPGSAQSGDEYYRRIKKRMQIRLQFLKERAKIEIVDTHAETVDLSTIEALVEKRLETIDE